MDTLAADLESTGELAYPERVGMHFDASDVPLLEARYLNITDQDLDAQVNVTLHLPTSPCPCARAR